MAGKTTGRDRKRAWRMFERFVSDLERSLAGTGAEIKCPDQIIDVDGDLREVDCSVRASEDRGPTLVVFECRDRYSGNDVTWIDAIESKGKDIRATKVVAVHRQPLSLKAQKKAKRVGIEVRQLKRVDRRTNPFGIVGFGFAQSRLQLGKGRFRFSSDKAEQAMYEKRFSQAAQEGLEGPVLFDSGRGSPCSVAEYVKEFVEANQLGVGLPPGTKLTRFLVIEPKGDRIFELRLKSGAIPIEWAEVEFTIANAAEIFEHVQSGQYIAPALPLDAPVDQFALDREGRLVTGAGITTERTLEDGRVEIQHVISTSEPIGFGPTLERALDELLSLPSK